jgi:hypothetical protein
MSDWGVISACSSPASLRSSSGINQQVNPRSGR